MGDGGACALHSSDGVGLPRVVLDRREQRWSDRDALLRLDTAVGHQVLQWSDITRTHLGCYSVMS